MILRRVIAHLRKQEWTAIGIDFIIVVVGVFIGIQVSNLNQARVERDLANSYLERIRDDIDTDLANYDDRLAFWSKVAAYGRTGLTYADTNARNANSQWDLLLAYFQASQVAEFLTTDATYDELKSAGELRLIGDLALRNALANYYTNAGNPAMTERPAYRVHVRGMIPIDVQLYIWTSCYRSNINAQQDFVDCAPPINETRAGAIVNAIRNDEALMAELRYWMSTMHVASLIGRDRVTLAREVRAAVDAELND
jgi:hypothetical protein